jgi:hypothetical protein
MWRQTLSVPIWSFGPIGTPAWHHLPESRDSVKELICEELQRAIDDDRDPVPVDQFEYVIHAVGPLVFDRLGVVDMDADLVRRFCLFCRDVLSYNGRMPWVCRTPSACICLKDWTFPELSAPCGRLTLAWWI